MKNQTPVLSKIKLCEFASQETPCFEALLTYRGQQYHISNSGNGGSNNYSPSLPDAVGTELNEWAAKNNPPITECGGYPVAPPLSMDFETWTFTQAFALCAS